MASLKDRISSPLEAGQSIHDAHHLPQPVAQALEYVSKRLARKAHHVTLAVVRKDYQLPAAASIPPPSPAPSSPPTSPGMMPSPSRLAFTKPASKLRSLVRSTNHPVLNKTGGSRSPGPRRSATGSPSYPDTTSPRLRWPMSPGSPTSLRSHPSTPGTPGTLPSTPRSIFSSVPPTPRSPPFMNPLMAHPPTPRTPATPSTMPPTPGAPARSSDLNSIILVYAMTPDGKADRVVRQSIEKAEKKFGISTSCAPLPSHNLPADLLRRSILQNEVLFSSEGVTLLSLDRLYTFKAAVATYTKTSSTFRLEDAVDELRRLVLESRRRGNSVIGGADENGRVNRSFLMRSYDFLGVTTKALRDVERAYARVYRFDRDEEDRNARSGSISGKTLVDGGSSRASSTVEELEETTPTQPQPAAATSMPPPPPPPTFPPRPVQHEGDDNPEPMSPLKDPRVAPVPPSIHFRRKASPLPPTVSIPPTPIDGVVEKNWEQKPQSPRQPMSPTPRVTSPQHSMQSMSRIVSQEHIHPLFRVASPQQSHQPITSVTPPQQQQPRQQQIPPISSTQPPQGNNARTHANITTADPPHSFDIPIVIPSTAAVNMAHRPKPDPLSPIDPLPISFPSPLASPGKGPALKLQTTFKKSLPPLPLNPNSPRGEIGRTSAAPTPPREEASGTTTTSASSNTQSSGTSQTPLTGTSLEAPIVMSVPSPVAVSKYNPFTFSPPQHEHPQPQLPKPLPHQQEHPQSAGLIRPMPHPIPRPVPQTPLIKIDTSVATTQPQFSSTNNPRGRGIWNGGNTIDSMLCPTNDGEGFPISAYLDGPMGADGKRLGPMTPNGYDDISPITMGEWGMLKFTGNDGMKGRTVTVETCWQ
ncbi:hypothetical protein MKZ38_003529 [Zalerion maritima]|uniref:DUF7582 domain-containing protein n=1 Tax=Zalerion maritima TaxID=339359 RepID=A0AAD5RMW8_9PEZI|nr:hypothetical protein MKZ38_003529 [Zalerion maritima]